MMVTHRVVIDKRHFDELYILAEVRHALIGCEVGACASTPPVHHFSAARVDAQIEAVTVRGRRGLPLTPPFAVIQTVIQRSVVDKMQICPMLLTERAVALRIAVLIIETYTGVLTQRKV